MPQESVIVCVSGLDEFIEVVIDFETFKTSYVRCFDSKSAAFRICGKDGRKYLFRFDSITTFFTSKVG